MQFVCDRLVAVRSSFDSFLKTKKLYLPYCSILALQLCRIGDKIKQSWDGRGVGIGAQLGLQLGWEEHGQ